MTSCHPIILSHEAVNAIMYFDAELCIKVPENIYEGDFTVKLGETWWIKDHFPAKVGEYIWVREDHRIMEFSSEVCIVYRDGMVLRRPRYNFEEPSFDPAKWRGPVAMPRGAARCIFKVLEINIDKDPDGKLFWHVIPEPVLNVIEFLDKLDREEWGTDE